MFIWGLPSIRTLKINSFSLDTLSQVITSRPNTAIRKYIGKKKKYKNVKERKLKNMWAGQNDLRKKKFKEKNIIEKDMEKKFLNICSE